MDKPKITNPKDFAIIRQMYFNPIEPRLKDVDQEELDSRWVSRKNNNNNHAR